MRPHERRAKCPSADLEDPRPAICCSSPRRTSRSTIPRNCHACRKGRNGLVESDRPAPSRRSRHAPTGKDTESACPSSCRTCRDTSTVFARKFRRPIRVCCVGKTSELLRVVPSVVLGARTGTTGVPPTRPRSVGGIFYPLSDSTSRRMRRHRSTRLTRRGGQPLRSSPAPTDETLSIR